MNRLQISLTATQYEFLQSEAFVTGKSMAALLRNMIDEAIELSRQDVLNNDPIWEAIGVGQDIEGPTDVSSNVDKYLHGESLESANNQPLRKIAEDPNEYTPD